MNEMYLYVLLILLAIWLVAHCFEWFFELIWYLYGYRYIKKGKHCPSILKFSFFHTKEVIKKIKIIKGESWLYKFNDEDDHDKNKIWGLSFAFLPRIRLDSFCNKGDVRVWFSFLGFIVIKPHHWSSVRFGWMCEDGKVVISPYVFRNGYRVYFNNSVAVDDIFVLEILIDKEFNGLNMYVNDMCILFTRSIKLPRIAYYLDAYFGGNKTAPHDIYWSEVSL